MSTLARALSALLVLTAVAVAQDATDPPAELAVRASVWGQVGRPGLYRLGGTPDLFEVLSAAGGPTSGADLKRVLIIREMDGTKQRVDVNRIAASGQPLFVSTGDVIIVPETFLNGLSRNLPVISTLAVVANLVVSMIIVTNR